MKKKALLLMLVLCLLACFNPQSAKAYDEEDMKNATEISFDEKVTLTGNPATFFIKVDREGILSIKGSGVYDFTAYIWNKKGTIDTNVTLVPSSMSSSHVEYEVSGKDTFYINATGAGRYIEVSFEEKQANSTMADAQTLNIKMNKEVTLETKTSKAEYYYLAPDDKSYYEFNYPDGTMIYLFDVNKEKIDLYSPNYNYDTVGANGCIVTACKNTPVYFELYSANSSKKASVTIKRTDFKEIKKLKFPSSTINVSGSKKVTLNIGGIKNYESRITYKMTDASGKEVNYFRCESEMDAPTKRHIVTIGSEVNYGVYTITATTSEGLTAKATVKLAPGKPDMIGTKSVGTTNSSTVTWKAQTGVDKYYVYLLKNGKYKKVGETKETSYTFKNLNAGKTYSFKIASVKTVKNAKGKKVTLVGDKSEEWKFITASAEKPVITSLSAGSTTYYPKHYVDGTSGYYDSFGNWHTSVPGYWVNAYSVASIKVNIKSSKIFKRYQYEEDNTKYVSSGSALTYSYSGKASAKSQKVKIRGVASLTNFNSTAYGKWSDAKSVTIKAAK